MYQHFIKFKEERIVSRDSHPGTLTIAGFSGNLFISVPYVLVSKDAEFLAEKKAHKTTEYKRQYFYSTCDLIQLLICVGRRDKRFARSEDSEASRMT